MEKESSINSKIVNFFGGPGAGKTTLAGELFGHMKRKRKDAVYLDETAAHMIRAKSPAINDQLYVTASQHHKQWSIAGEVEWIITDSPIILGCVYIFKPDAYSNFMYSTSLHRMKQNFKHMMLDLFLQYNNINFVVERGDREFKQIGRRQTEQQSKELDSEIVQLLHDQGIEYWPVANLTDVIGVLEKHYG